MSGLSSALFAKQLALSALPQFLCPMHSMLLPYKFDQNYQHRFRREDQSSLYNGLLVSSDPHAPGLLGQFLAEVRVSDVD